MKRQDLAQVLKSISARELKGLISVREKLDTLEKKRRELAKNLAAVDKEISSLKAAPVKSSVTKKPGPKKKVAKKKVTKKKPVAKKKAPKKKAKKAPAAKKKTTKSKAAKKKTVKKATRRVRKKALQPSISSLIVDILKEKKKPLSVNEICDILLKEKKYKTKSKKFGNQIRVMLYRNDKGLFKKAGPGTFKLA